MTSSNSLRRLPFLSAVFLITFSILIFQIAQTRILSVITWYHLAFFAISVAMLGMTVGAVWLYLWRERFERSSLAVTLSDFALATAVAMPASVVVSFAWSRRFHFAHHGSFLELAADCHGSAVRCGCDSRRRSTKVAGSGR